MEQPGWSCGRVRWVPHALQERLRRLLRLLAMRAQIRASHPLNVILGAGPVSVEGWISTDADILDVTSTRGWRKLFSLNSIDRLMAEHVMEHLSDAECTMALSACFRYLKKGGLLRIAVPDGNRKDSEYIEEVSPPKDGHKLLFTVDDLVARLNRVGFEATPLEYFDVSDQFHSHPWAEADGLIRRSIRHDRQERFKRGTLYYTSLIVDARKP